MADLYVRNGKSWCRALKRLSLKLAIVASLVPLINGALQLQHNNLPEPQNIILSQLFQRLSGRGAVSVEYTDNGPELSVEKLA
jgi:hypothetical protein